MTWATTRAQAQLPPPAPTDGDQQPAPPSTSAPPYVSPDETPLPTPTPQAPRTPPVAPIPKTPNPAKTAQPKSLTIGGISIRGLSDFAAIKKLKLAHDKKLRERVTLWDGREKHLARRAFLGASIPYYKLLAEARSYQKTGADIPLRFEGDERQARRAMKYFAAKVNHAPANASLDVEDGKAVLRGGEGAELAIEGSAQRVQAALESEPPQGYIELVVVHQRGTSTLRRFKYLLAEYATPYDASILGRTNNLKMAARHVDGTIIPAGKTFSTNAAIGPRNASAGWREAKMFVNGEVVDGVGAGICQCSTTIYNAALLANLPIAERHPHTFKVKYAEASRDAAIYWGQKDMRFKNNTGGPIYVQTFVRDDHFIARLYGTQQVRAKVEVESRILSRGKGISSEAYRIVQTDAGTTRERLSRDYYRPKKS
jgi:vancomycin resistance protein YoaR